LYEGIVNLYDTGM